VGDLPESQGGTVIHTPSPVEEFNDNGGHVKQASIRHERFSPAGILSIADHRETNKKGGLSCASNVDVRRAAFAGPK